MLLPLTDKQTNVLLALQSYIDEHEYPPTIPELSKLLGKVNVGGEITVLRKKGWAMKIEGQGTRCTTLTDEALVKLNKKEED
jgi:SOS-response transcriptional repressor LexA